MLLPPLPLLLLPELTAPLQADNVKKTKSDLRIVFGAIDCDGDGMIGVADLAETLAVLEYEVLPGEVEQILWEVDDDRDGGVTWREFRSMYTRVRDDKYGIEPRRLYNLAEFLLFDLDGDGKISSNDAIEVFYRRWGRDMLFSQMGVKGIEWKRREKLKFSEFVKFDLSFVPISRQMQDAENGGSAALEDSELLGLNSDSTGSRHRSGKLFHVQQRDGDGKLLCKARAPNLPLSPRSRQTGGGSGGAASPRGGRGRSSATGGGGKGPDSARRAAGDVVGGYRGAETVPAVPRGSPRASQGVMGVADDDVLEREARPNPPCSADPAAMPAANPGADVQAEMKRHAKEAAAAASEGGSARGGMSAHEALEKQGRVRFRRGSAIIYGFHGLVKT